MASAENTSIYVLNRNNYDNFPDGGYGNNIFFVRENSSDSAEIISLYVGKAKQCDLLDITNSCSVEMEDDYWETIDDTNPTNLGNYPVYPGTLKLRTSGGKTYTDDHNNIVYNGNIVGAINYNTGEITYTDNADSNDYPNQAQYTYSILNINDPEHNYNLGSHVEYQIPNKMFFYEQILDKDGYVMQFPFYRTLMWKSGTSEELTGRFIECSPEQFIWKNGTLSTTNKNIISGTDMCLQSILDYDEDTEENSVLQLPCLPRNGGEIRITSGSIYNVTIQDITKMDYYQGQENKTQVNTTDDYISVLIFRKGENHDNPSSTIETSNILYNFNPDVGDEGNKIFLMNPDMDISEFDIIHILLYNDGFHICAIVAGYDEQQSFS